MYAFQEPKREAFDETQMYGQTRLIVDVCNLATAGH